jgi:hypothetical protein
VSNITAGRAQQLLIASHIERELTLLEKRIERDLELFKQNTLLAVAIDEQLNGANWIVVRQIVTVIAAERALANATMLRMARKMLLSACAKRLAGTWKDAEWRRRWAAK